MNRATREQPIYISFFQDDTIDTVRQHIGAAVNIHPDRLFITVTLQRPKTYFKDDPRNWESLYKRLSYNTPSILRTPFQVYQSQIRSPATAVPFEEYGADEWKHPTEDLMPLFSPAEDFKDKLIFGTDETLSYILPYEYDTTLTSRIMGTMFPIPQKNALISTLYPHTTDILGFEYTVFDSSAETSKSIYFPFLQITTPEQLPLANIQLLKENSTRLGKLLALEVPSEKDVSFLRVSYKIPLVETDFGNAIRARFEQMFYGLTVSESTPCISFFTSFSENTRHKFYVKDSRNKTPQNFQRWQRWWHIGKPANSKPTLVLFRGVSNDNFDRIAITSTKITLASTRPDGFKNDETSLRESLKEWILSLDSILPFIAIGDVSNERWELQDMSLSVKYRSKYKDPSPLRLNCLSTIFALTDAETSTFQLLRTDHFVAGLSSMQVKVIQMTHERANITVDDIQTELGVSTEVANNLKDSVKAVLEENPEFLNRSFKGFPTVVFGDTSAIIKGVKDPKLSVKYANILRFILLNSDASKLNKICPPRKETVRAETAIAPMDEQEINKELANEYLDAFDDIEEETQPEKAEPEEETVTKQLGTNKAIKSTYNYFNKRLQDFDDITFDPKNSQYPKKCDQDHQPIILSRENLENAAKKGYDPTTYLKGEEKIEISDPQGLVICPEYWCIVDEIPLRKADLINNACPECGGKIRTKGKKVKESPRVFSVIERGKEFSYPGLTPYTSTKNGRQLPCCRKEPFKDPTKVIEDKFYILGETATDIPKYRCSFLPKNLMQSLFIKETYQLFLKGDIKRIQNANSGFFRVGMGKPYSSVKPISIHRENEDKTCSTRKQVVKSGPVETLPRLLGCVDVNKRAICSKETVRIRKGEGEKELKARESGDWYKIPTPRKSIDTVLGCSFINTWTEMGETHLDEIKQHPKCSNNDILARIVSGIDEAFFEKKLTALQELEYAALCLQCDVFRISTETNTLSCMFYSPLARARSRGIIVLQNKEGDLDILSNVMREKQSHIECSDMNEITDFSFRSNIFQPPFVKSTYVEMEKLRNIACSSGIPTYTDALNAIQEILPVIGASDYSIILDPFGRAQAFYIPYKLLLPFQPSPLPPTSQIPIQGYSGIISPKYEDVMKYLKLASKVTNGKYVHKQDIYNNNKERVEILLESGLRIPVVPSVPVENVDVKEVIETVKNLRRSEDVLDGEEELTFGKEDEALKDEYGQISYTSEVFDFLFFELSKDIREKYPDLLLSLRKTHPARPEVEPLLREWFDDATFAVDLKSASEFVTKVRAPCGSRTKEQCSGNVCGWDGDRCKIQVKNSLRTESLFNRFLSTLITNAKLRGIVLDGRSTPFFSTILYVELPHELIMTDKDLK